MSPYAHAQHDALRAFGLEKQALDFRQMGTQALNWAKGPGLDAAKRVGGNAVNAVKNLRLPTKDEFVQTMVGEPRRVWSEFRQGTLHKPGGALHQSFMPQGKLDAAMRFGLPALGVVGALTAPPEQRGSAVGNALGQVAGGFIGGPLGMLGQMGASTALGALGSSVGSAFDQKPQDPYAAYR